MIVAKYKNIQLILFLVFGLVFSVFGQEKSDKDALIDSMYYYLDRSYKEKYSFDKSLFFLNKAVDVSDYLMLDSLQIESRVVFAEFYQYNRLFPEMKNSLDEVFKLFKPDTSKQFVYANILLGNYFERTQKLDSAYYSYNKAKKISLALKDSLLGGDVSLNIARFYCKVRDFVSAEHEIIQGLKYLEPGDKGPWIINSLYVLLASCKFEQYDEEEAMNLYRKSYNIAVKEKDTLIMLNALNNMSYTSSYCKNKDSVMLYLEKGLAFKGVDVTFPEFYGMMLANLTYEKFLVGDTKDLLENYQKSYEIAEKISHFRLRIMIHNFRGHFYKKKGDTKKAIQQGLLSLKMSRANSSNDWLLKNLKLLAVLDKENAVNYINQFNSLSDSLQKNEYKYVNRLAGIAYETQKKDKENRNLKEDNKLKSLDYERVKYKKTVIVLLLILSILGFVIMYMRFRNRNAKIIYEAELSRADVKEEERDRVVRKLNKEISNELFEIEGLLKKAGNLKLAVQTRRVTEIIGEIATELSIKNFDDISFNDQVKDLIKSYETENFKLCLIGLDKVKLKKITDLQKQALYLGIRESIHNSVKHAEATRITVKFSHKKTKLKVVITDNGRGFNTDSKRNGIGLKNIKERILRLKGTFLIQSKINEGTRTQISVEFKKRGKEHETN